MSALQHQLSLGYLCGVCGDPYDQPQPRDNEAGGPYGNGIITRQYQQGQTIQVTVDLTAQHKGWFEFRICPTNNPKTIATHACLDQYLLPLSDGSGTRLNGIAASQIYVVSLTLPADLTCSQCVLQWKYHTGQCAFHTYPIFSR